MAHNKAIKFAPYGYGCQALTTASISFVDLIDLIVSTSG